MKQRFGNDFQNLFMGREGVEWELGFTRNIGWEMY